MSSSAPLAAAARIVALVAIAALIGWCLTLLGYGADRLLHDHDKPGIVGAVIVLPLIVAGLVWVAVRVFRSGLTGLFAGPS